MTEPQHDLERLIHNSSIDVPLAVRRAAFAAVAQHPNFAIALSHPQCFAVMFVEPKSFFDRSRWPGDVKAEIVEALRDTDSVVLLSFMTSRAPRFQPLSGGGVSYDFAIHPNTCTILHATLGSWRT